MWVILTLLFFLALIGSLVGLIFRRARRKAKWIAAASFPGLVISIIALGGQMDEEARQKGFLDDSDLRRAETAGITDPRKWRALPETAKAVETAAAEAGRTTKAVDQAQRTVTALALVEPKTQADARRSDLLRPPREQANFMKAVERGRARFEKGENDLQRGAARPSRSREICDALPGQQITGWIGTIATLSTNGDGDGVVSIKLADQLHLITWNNAFSDTGSNTLIKPNSALYAQLLAMKVGDVVRIQGKMFPSPQDCHRETSITLSGSVNDPHFSYVFPKSSAWTSHKRLRRAPPRREPSVPSPALRAF